MSAQANTPTGQEFSNTLVEMLSCQLEDTMGKRGAHEKKIIFLGHTHRSHWILIFVGAQESAFL